jgi:glycosyltransferase involved in cell wall biosynthesis
MKKPNDLELISVIIPMYNAEKTITAALNSIACQTDGNFEIIIVNDGSADNSISQVYAFKKLHPELHITIIDKEHEGVSATRNTGLRIASGNYIAFLDADDEWHPEKTVKQLAILSNQPDTAFVGCLYKPVTKSLPPKKVSWLTYVSSKDQMFKNFFQTSTVMMKRNVFEAVGYFERSRSHAEERHYFLRISTLFSCALINENLVNYGNGKRAFGQSGLSGDLLQMEMGELKNLVYAYKELNMPLFTCCNAIIFSLVKFVRRIFIVHVSDAFKASAYEKK